MFEMLVLTLTVMMLIITILPFAPSNHWICRVWEFPRVQIACIALVLACLSLVYSPPYLSTALPLVNLLVAIYQFIWILPYTWFYPKEVPLSATANPKPSIKIMNSNVLMPNHSAEKLITLIEQHQPDVVVTLESDTWWQQALETIHPSYPYRVKRPLDNLYGMHLYSKYPLHDVQLVDLVEEGVPSIHCYLLLQDKFKIKCHFLHPAPPSPTENTRATPRDRELLLIAKEVKDKTEPTIVTGDLNDVAWSPTTRAFRRISGLRDPRIGRGMFNTFHAKYAFLRWPLDHIFHSEHFHLVQLHRLPSIDSDHFPLMSELEFHQKHE